MVRKKLETEVVQEIEGIFNAILGFITKKDKKKALTNIHALYSLFDMYELSTLNQKLSVIEDNVKAEKWTDVLKDFKSLIAKTLEQIQ